jgi:DNA repair protein RadC
MNEAVPQAITQPGPPCPQAQGSRAPRTFNAKEYKLVALRECPLPEEMDLCDTADKAAAYWRAHVTSHPAFNPEAECFVVLLLNTRRRIKGHLLVATGTLDTILVHPREVFRAAIVAAAAAVVIMHNHPSGEPQPSEADIKVTRDLIRAGQLLKIEVLDHVIVGAGDKRVSLRELGYFFS